MLNPVLIAYVLTTSLGLVTLKLGSNHGAIIELVDKKLVTNLNFYSIVGLALYGISFFLYMYLIAKNDLGYIIPIAAAMVYILVFTASYFIFKESFTPLKIGGIALIIVGLFILNFRA